MSLQTEVQMSLNAFADQHIGRNRTMVYRISVIFIFIIIVVIINILHSHYQCMKKPGTGRAAGSLDAQHGDAIELSCEDDLLFPRSRPIISYY
jgi:hypothetical protein